MKNNSQVFTLSPNQNLINNIDDQSAQGGSRNRERF